MQCQMISMRPIQCDRDGRKEFKDQKELFESNCSRNFCFLFLGSKKNFKSSSFHHFTS